MRILIKTENVTHIPITIPPCQEALHNSHLLLQY